LEPDLLYVEDGPLVTSAGSAAGIDACLHILRAEHGSKIANAVARRMVVPPHRGGGQRQYIEAPVPCSEAETLAPLLDWVVEHLDEPMTVETLADRSAMSARTFARRFRGD
jgi:transcriptional regulator GlxA family with amidase domain